jgi:Cof subfamily protein (haloacid dehalogenase superfamily)
VEKTLYISDLDGTLLDSDSKIQKFSEDIINRLISQGMQFSIATARSWSSASQIVKGLNLNLPVVTYNGAFIVDPVSGNIIESSCFEKAQADHVLNALIKADIYPLVYSFINKEERVSWVGNKENEGIKYYLKLRKDDKRLRSVNSADDLFDGDIFYFTAIGTRDKLETLTRLFVNDSYFSYTFQQELYRDEYWLEIKKYDATKAVGVEKIKRIAGCSRVISFGDSLNDLPMFSISDEAYAVSNANKKLIAAATKVIENADDNGVARWLDSNLKTKEVC